MKSRRSKGSRRLPRRCSRASRRIRRRPAYSMGSKANLSDEAMRSQFMQTFAQFPNRPIKSGETWNGSGQHQQPHVGRARSRRLTSTLKAVEGEGNSRVAKIATGLTIKQDATKPGGGKPNGPDACRWATVLATGSRSSKPVPDRLRSSVDQIHAPDDDVGHRAGRHADEHEDERQGDHDRGTGSVVIADH